MMLKVFSSISPETDGINIGIRADDEEIDLNGSCSWGSGPEFFKHETVML